MSCVTRTVVLASASFEAPISASRLPSAARSGFQSHHATRIASTTPTTPIG